MFISVIFLIILLVIKNSECKKLKEENRKLKEELQKRREVILKAEDVEEQVVEKETINIQPKKEVIEQIKQEPQAIVEQEKQELKTKKSVKNKQEHKNISILVTGSICIVLAAIVFLMSTWYAIPNILKTMVLALVTVVFFGGSHIAKEKFKLDKASKTFFYIAMAYIPICLLSIAAFGLLGDYLSLYGEGRDLYLILSSLFVSLIYYKTYISKNSKYLFYGSILSQMFAIQTFSIMFSDNVVLVGINLLIYNIGLILITRKNTFRKIYNFIPIISIFILSYNFDEQSKAVIFMLFLLAINFLILELKNSKKIYSYMFNILLTLFGIYTILLFKDVFGTNGSYILILGFMVLLYTIENMLLANSEREGLKNSLTIVTICTIGMLYSENTINKGIIVPSIILAVQTIILIITYIKSKSIGKTITAILIPITIINMEMKIMIELECSYHAYIIFAFITFIASEVFRRRDKLIHRTSFVISHVFIVGTYLTVLASNFNDFTNDMFYAVLLTSLYVYNYFVSKDITFKYLSHITLNFVFVTVFEFLIPGTELVYYVPMISTLVSMGIETIYKGLRDYGSDIYFSIAKVVSFIFIYISTSVTGSEISTIIAIIFAIIIMIDNIKYKQKVWNILPLTCVIPALFFNELNAELQVGIMLLSVTGTTVASLKEKRASVFTVFSGIYLILTLFEIESIYLKEIIFACWAVLQFLFKTIEKERDVFKFLTYISILLLYESMILDLGLEVYTLFYMLGKVVTAILIIRTIFSKYMSKVDTWEYIIFGFIYLTALSQYADELDGMLFGILIVAIVIISYIKKYGALFMVSIFAILVNIFALTREFWFSIPWWIYLLSVGAVLISFAIKNEVSDKKTEINARTVLKNIKDKVER